MNSVNITGRVAADPALRTLPNGTAACKLRLAVRGLARGEEEVGYVNVTSYGPGGEAAANVLERGWLVAVTGRLEYHDWETQDGTKRRDWEVIGQIQFLAAPRENGTRLTALPATETTPAETAQPQPAAA
jgi:single-strand DNA-binding protein